MTDSDTQPAAANGRFQRTLVRVLVVQFVALVLLGLLQFVYSG